MVTEERFTVLVVDDDKTNLDVLTKILAPRYRVIAAKSGKAALERIRSNPPDIILLDVLMSDMDGFAVISVLKADDATRHIPVIFITALDSVEYEERGFELGAVDYISKPFHSTLVRARVNTHLRIVAQIRTIERLCLMDALTELTNRRGFDERFEAEWARAVRDKIPLGMLVMDLDFFKTYNDTYGHPQGDAMLQAAAKTFTGALKRQTDFAARVGGEEFAVLLPHTDEDGAQAVGEQVREAVERLRVPLIKDDEVATRITVSIGAAAVWPDSGMKRQLLLDLADQAVYRAKEGGRNRVSL